jgi:hypothetical protein
MFSLVHFLDTCNFGKIKLEKLGLGCCLVEGQRLSMPYALGQSSAGKNEKNLMNYK